ncbi:MAG: Coenzyme F420 hydrogenase/dehydrogenase, beta subunit C-terminal domain [Spirochaetaceae bacterium]|nr:Coenzyme F420 hydrogenase/dehydrogenase, beta subunit C-terminal domain [Spirochaetaceae bacterium]
MKTIKALNKNHCTGCGACVNACRAKSISMKADAEGFFYPSINPDLCSGCSLCYSVCPALNSQKPDENHAAVKIYAAWSLDNEVRYNSTSGGIFTELAKTVIKNGGCAVGAKYNANHLVEHILIDKIDDIYLLRQSKYVQSETNGIFKKAEIELQKGRQVLFSGTPCQCGGMMHYLQKEYKNLILCDFICRGVNSPLVYLKYLNELEEKYNARVKQVWFKNKTNGWNRFGTKIIFDDGQEYFKSRDDDPFMRGYIKNGLNLYMRPSCGICMFKGVDRPVDITLGDFWGMKTDPDYGVSMVMLHSAKGGDFFEKIKANIHSEQSRIEDILPYNRCLYEAAKPRKTRNNFWMDIRHKSFMQSIEYYI